MRDPYEVLGVPRNATKEQIKAAYKTLAKKYHPDNYASSPLRETAEEKMAEINEAYDAIMSGDNRSYKNSGYTTYSNGFYEAEELLRNGKLDAAEQVLENMDLSQRSARWYFLKGQINYKRGWTDQAYSYFNMAYNMEPGNAEYRNAFENMKNRQSGGYRTQRKANRNRQSDLWDCCECCLCDCDGCDICTGLLCADCCCECTGGDLIGCC